MGGRANTPAPFSFHHENVLLIMARSNSGGTRGWLRGKVANDLYQVTKTSTGRKVQLVRAVEESRVNNNTIEQALARMRMALLMGALGDLKAIVDHSWQTIPYGQLSIAHFVKENMQEVIADCKENWSGECRFCYPTKGVRAMRIGMFRIASGTLATPSNITRGVSYIAGQWFPFRINIGKANPTFGDLRRSLGLNANDYITLLMATGLDMGSSGIVNQGLQFVRLYLAENVLDETEIVDDNVADMFTYDGNTTWDVSLDIDKGEILVRVFTGPDGVNRDTLLSSVIVSRWDGKAWCRNNAWFMANSDADAPNFEYNAPRWVFKSWFPSYDPDADGSDVYPGKQ